MSSSRDPRLSFRIARPRSRPWWRWGSALLMMLLAAPGAAADVGEARHAAELLAARGEHEEALGAFIALADQTSDETIQSYALAESALCAHRLGRHERAMALIEQVPVSPVRRTVRMQVLAATESWDALLDRFQDMSFADWAGPLAGEAHLFRARALKANKHWDRAARDLRRAVSLLPNGERRIRAARALADVQRNEMDDPDAALSAYLTAERVQRMYGQPNWRYYHTILSAADLLKQKGAFGRALKLLDSTELAKRRGHWGGQYWLMRADILAAQGRPDAAIESLEAAKAMEGLREQHREAISAHLSALQEEGE